LYLANKAIVTTLTQIAAMAPGSTLVMSFYLPIEYLDQEDKFMQEIAEKGDRDAKTPMISFFAADEILKLAQGLGIS